VNGALVHAHDLEAGDRLEVGQHLLRFRLEPLEHAPRVYCIPED
jgi:hypothetical protein